MFCKRIVFIGVVAPNLKHAVIGTLFVLDIKTRIFLIYRRDTILQIRSFMRNDEGYTLEEIIMSLGAFLVSVIFSFIIIYVTLQCDFGESIMRWIGILPTGFSIFLLVFGMLIQIVENIFYDE